MKRLLSYALVCTATLLAFGLSNPVLAAESGPLRVAAFKMDITPVDPTGLYTVYRTRLTGVHDKTWARGIVLDNGHSSAAIVAFDAVEVADGTAMIARLSKATGIPTANIILTATHDHSSPLIGLQNASGDSPGGPGAAAYMAKVEADLTAAMKQARANEQPARMGIATGHSSVNINRDLPTEAGPYVLGRNPDGVSDKTVWVLRFDNTAGQPIALLTNYAVHSTVMDPKTSLVTGELAGAASRFVEKSFDDKVVNVWTIGAAGDQNPVVAESDPSQPNGEVNFGVANVLGQILGTEIVRVAKGIKPTTSDVKLWGAESTASCPGQKTLRESDGKFKAFADDEPVKFRVGLLMLNQIAIGSVAAEVVTNIYLDLRTKSPYTNTILITLANSRIGYVPQDVSYDNPTFEVYGSPLKKGCGESSIVNGIVDLMQKY